VRDDETILVYSQPKKIKLRNIRENPKVTLGLDVTDIGRDIIRIDGTAEHVGDVPSADRQPQYAVKYAERIGAMFGTPRQFAELFSEALIITPTRLHA
jgi:PPOX class probable F420-dependent enzyme